MTNLKIGIDLDNTIINYQNSFDEFLKKKNINLKKVNKNRVKFISNNNSKIKNWTQAQEEIYGYYIFFAKPFKYFKEFEKFAIKNKIRLFIISHKTRYSQYSRKYNLHTQSNNWIKNNILDKNYKIFYTKSIDEKIKKISELNLNYFIDDLIEIFNHTNFPKKVKKVHFSNVKQGDCLTFSGWDKIKKHILQNETF